MCGLLPEQWVEAAAVATERWFCEATGWWGDWLWGRVRGFRFSMREATR